jgi:hypothetical protein
MGDRRTRKPESFDVYDPARKSDWDDSERKIPRGPVIRENSRGKGIDIKELLKREAFGAQNSASDSHFEKGRPSPSEPYGVSDHYLLFDSFEKVETSDPAKGTFKFNIMTQGVTRDQAIGSKNKIETIIWAQIDTFTIPLLAADAYITNDPATNSALPRLVANVGAPTSGSLGVPLTQLPFSDKITIQLEEMGAQAYVGKRDTRHHYEMDATLRVPQGGGSADRITLEPGKHGWDTYVFTDPIKSCESLTFVFRNPDVTVAFPPDVLYGTTAQTSAAQLLQFNFIGHGLNAGDRIYIKGFTSGNSIIDNYVRRQAGLLVGTGGLTADSFRLNPDVDVTVLGLGANAPILPPATPPATDNTTPIPPSTRIDVRIAKNRIRIPLRIRGVVGYLTNYIAP